MKLLNTNDELIPEHFSVEEFSLSFDGQILSLRMRSADGALKVLEATGVLSYRFSLEEVYSGYVEGSLNVLISPAKAQWPLRYVEEQNSLGEFIRTREFYHLNVPDVGILECWATGVRGA